MNRIINSTLTLTFLAIVVVSCQAPRTNVAEVKKAVEEADARQMKAFADKDLAGMMANYAPDAVILPQNGPAATGKEKMEGMFKEFSDMMTDMKWTITKFDASGDIAYEVGEYTATMHMPGMAPAPDKGKFVTVWKRQADGTWKIVVDIFNTDLAPPMPQPEKTKK
jgi:uncharacterized protein (TIGR02246 family)